MSHFFVEAVNLRKSFNSGGTLVCTGMILILNFWARSNQRI